MNHINNLLQIPTHQVNQEHLKKRYFEKKQDALYFILERFCEENENFWNAFAYRQNKEAGRLYNSSQDKTLQAIIAGTIGFRDSINCHQIFAANIPHELWILFASTELPQEHSFPDIESLEMTCTVSTAPEAPFTTHMGVFRTINSNLKNHKIHCNISVALHAFGAKIMKDLYPQKLYMITTPMPHMEAIFKKALGEKNINIALEEDWEHFIQEKQAQINLLSKKISDFNTEKNSEVNKQLEVAERTIEYYNKRITSCHSSQIIVVGRSESSFTLKDLNGRQIICLHKADMDGDYGWYFRRETTFSGRNNIVAIPLQILADYNP